MGINKALMYEVLASIKSNESHWDQRMGWHNANRHCFAGFVDLIMSGTPVGSILPPNQRSFTEPNTMVDMVARVELGITPDQEFYLFRPRNTLKDLERLVHEYCEQEEIMEV